MDDAERVTVDSPTDWGRQCPGASQTKLCDNGTKCASNMER